MRWNGCVRIELLAWMRLVAADVAGIGVACAGAVLITRLAAVLTGRDKHPAHDKRVDADRSGDGSQEMLSGIEVMKISTQ